jgi:hypothetical protein
MKILARITAIVLIISGILLLFGSLTLGLTGAIRSIFETTATPLRTGRAIGLIADGFIFVLGLTITALGEGLYLLTDIANRHPA